MPVGVQVGTALAPGGGGTDSTDPTTYFPAGLTERGSATAPVLVRSLAEAVDLLGTRQAYGAIIDDLTTFFGEAGPSGRAYVARVVGAAATVGTLTLNDRAAAPLATLRVDANSPGAWSANTTVEVRNGTLANTYDLLVYYKGALVERFNGLSSPADAVTATVTSGYVVVTNLGSATAAPNNNPAAVGPTALSAGNDDRGSVTSGSYVSALARFNADLGPGIVAIPGQPASAVGTGLISHASANGRIAALAPALGTSTAGASAAAQSLRSVGGNESGGLFYPWVQIPDGAGGVRTISPEGFVAGRRADTITRFGTFRAPAGQQGRARFVVGLEQTLTTDQVNSLSDDAVNVLRIVAGQPRLYGWRSLSLDLANFRFLNGQDLLNELRSRAQQVLEPYVFAPIDGRGLLFSAISTDLTSLVAPIADAGGLYANPNGTQPDPGYRVDTGPTVNTPTTIARGEVRAVLNLRISPVGELIRVTLVKVPLSGNV